MNKELSARVDRAGQVLDKAEKLLEKMENDSSIRALAKVESELAPVLEAVEEAQQLLFDEQDEVEDRLPEPDESMGGDREEGREEPEEQPKHGVESSEGEDEEADPVLQQFVERKGALEQRSRNIEATAYEAAARRLAPTLSEGSPASEEQEKFLASAVSALEAHFLAENNPAILVRIAGLDLLRREVKKAKVYLAKALELEPNGPVGEGAKALLERIQSDPAIKDKSRCFIATAAMGSADASEVRTLRSFRDRVLMKHTAGRLLVAAYYEVSPPMARVLENNAGLREATARFFIRPLAKAARRLPGVD